ncbi:MAG: hypothetical protein B6241_01330 [Spirochaetaceae bacterium 4572_59]|nr:MAG: hypothetical protein B6241_01330 [Spirochaetaceae bacterium 4572_59]
MTAYQIAWQKKRTFNSFLAAFLLHFLLICGILLYNLLFTEELEDFSGPVLVKLGEPAGIDLPLPPEPSDIIEVPEEPVPEVPETPVIPETASIPTESLVSEDIPDKRPPSESETTSSQPVLAAADPVPLPVKPEAVKIEGSENGNAHETVFSIEEGNVGRNVWIPISLFMPLPVNLEERYVHNLKGDALNTVEEYKQILLRYYKESPLGSGYYLETSVSDRMSYEERRTIWVMLEKAGYDLSHPEYKDNRTLRPVVLSFSVVPGTGLLEEVHLERSCGYSDLDDAVLYGFEASQYYNSTARKIKGRFTYRFE